MSKRVADLLQGGRVVVYVGPTDTVQDAARIMKQHNVGSVLVLDGGRLAGIFTERDVVRRVVAEQREPSQTPLSEVMTPDVIVVDGATSSAQVLALMRQRGFRHAPVAVESTLIGVVSLRDLLREQTEETVHELEQLREYVFTRPYPVYPA